MERGRRILLALWIVSNAAVLAFLVLNPQLTRHGCSRFERSNGTSVDLCADRTLPLAERKYVAAGAILANGVALAMWVTLKPSSLARPASSDT